MIFLVPHIHKVMSRKRRSLPVNLKHPIMRVMYNKLFKEDLLVDNEKIKVLFGVWHRKNYKLGSYALICGPVQFMQDVISNTSTNLCISFHYKVYNSYDVLQWPDD